MPDDLLAELLPSWRRAMGGANKSRATIELYTGGVRVFLRWCAAQDVPELTKDSVNAIHHQPVRPPAPSLPPLSPGRRRCASTPNGWPPR